MRKTTSIVLDEKIIYKIKVLAAKLGIRPNKLIEQAIQQRLAEEEESHE